MTDGQEGLSGSREWRQEIRRILAIELAHAELFSLPGSERDRRPRMLIEHIRSACERGTGPGKTSDSLAVDAEERTITIDFGLRAATPGARPSQVYPPCIKIFIDSGRAKRLREAVETGGMTSGAGPVERFVLASAAALDATPGRNVPGMLYLDIGKFLKLVEGKSDAIGHALMEGLRATCSETRQIGGAKSRARIAQRRENERRDRER